MIEAAKVADSSSRNAVSFSSARTTRRFPSPRCALPFGRLWYGEPDAISNAIDYAKFYSCSHDAVIRIYDEAGNVITTHEQNEQFQRAVKFSLKLLGIETPQ
jgi:hypothetical protein